MNRFYTISRTVAVSSMLALSAVSVPAFAGKHEQAVEAIAQARGKIEAGDKVGTSAQAPELQAQARLELATAETYLSHGKKAQAISAAHHAGDLADQAIVSADNRRTTAERDRRLDAQSSTIEAQQSAAVANLRADSAQQAVVSANGRADAAQQAAVLANYRADAAQSATIAANAQTDALRNAPPSPATTTVAIIEKQNGRATAPVGRVHHRLVRKHRGMSHPKTTTTVTTTSR